jgi:NADPH:quinone reductase-like Zn-dependent oxidoreductase
VKGIIMDFEIIIPKAGVPEVFTQRPLQLRAPAANEVRIEVQAAGINFADISARLGFYPDAPPFPFAPGYEVAGRVNAVGSAVTHLQEGDAVCALTRFGGYATAVVTDAGQVMPLPPEVDPELAAAVPVTHLTAHCCLYAAGGFGDGMSVLILGGAGGVGSAALQMCRRHSEVTLFATAGSDAKCDWLRRNGADHALNYHTVDLVAAVRAATGGRGVDLVLDPGGGSSLLRSLRATAPLGRVVFFGVRDASPGKKRQIWPIVREVLPLRFFNLIPLLQRNVGVHGINMLTLAAAAPERTRSWFQQILRGVADGSLQPVVDQRFPLTAAGAAQAHHYIQDRKNIGKVLLVREEDV